MDLNRRIIGFCGAGGTGKTKVLEKFIEKLEEEGVNHAVQYSVVRNFYALKKIESEKDLLHLEEVDRVNFQYELAEYFVSSLDETLKNNSGFIICDRTIFDHLAYWLHSGQTSIKLHDYNRYVELCHKYCKKVLFLTRFPYPQSFSKDVDPDSFRYAPPAKNIIIDSLIERHLFDQQFCIPKFNVIGQTIEERVESIFTDLVCYGGLNSNKNKE